MNANERADLEVKTEAETLDRSFNPPGNASLTASGGPPANETSFETSDTDANALEQRIREAAYRRYEARGGEHGHDADDWAEAEAEVRSNQQQG